MLHNEEGSIPGGRAPSPAVKSDHDLWPGWAQTSSNTPDASSVPGSATHSQVTPEPLSSWATFGIPHNMLANLASMGLKEPKVAQSELLRIMETKRSDALVTSPNKSGKTVGACLSAVLFAHKRYMQQGRRAKRFKSLPTVIVICTTRERATETFKVLKALTRGGPVRAVKVTGDVGWKYQLKQLRMGCDVVVATPGRLIDIVIKGRYPISGTEYLIMDHATALLDIIDENTIFAFLSNFYSKKFGNDVEGFLQDDESLVVSTLASAEAGTMRRAGMTFMNASDEAVDTQKIREAIDTIGRRTGKAMIFANNRHQIQQLRSMLQGTEGLVVLQGDYITSAEREAALRRCENKDAKVILATDRSANGIRVSDVELVIHGFLPQVTASKRDGPIIRYLARNARAARPSVPKPTTQSIAPRTANAKAKPTTTSRTPPGATIAFYRKQDEHLFPDLAYHLLQSGQQQMNRISVINLFNAGATIAPSQTWRRYVSA
ncbi:P-loop containing nucleoside triphosphate hydrolase protein [Phyllosticta citribraziliensis]